MRNLPFEFIARKNKIANPNAWIWLFQIQALGDDTFFLTNNNECIEFEGVIYDPLDIELSELSSSLRGDLPEITIALSNISQEIMSYVETYDGLIGNTIKLQLINTETEFAESYIEDLLITETSFDNNNIEFVCTFLALEQTSFPGIVYVKDFCRWEFTSDRCGLPAAIVNPGETCTKSLNGTFGCIYWGNQEELNALPRLHPKRFGAFPTLPTGRVFEV